MPNPSQGVFSVTFSEINTDDVEVLVYSLEGKLLKSSFLENGSVTLSLVGYPKGQYIVKLVTAKNIYSQIIQIY
ncbi:MAG: T9SS type A sorting domain-containing protein [Saprospiraceae bacterium]|nr:T9SS type A sorting domain-containing protein [Saprospiraceae bacterium]